VVFEMEKVINRPVKIFLTGGAAPILQERLRLSVRVYPDLVLSGLAVIAAQTGAA
jgi:pantothenate kinase type III